MASDTSNLTIMCLCLLPYVTRSSKESRPQDNPLILPTVFSLSFVRIETWRLLLVNSGHERTPVRSIHEPGFVTLCDTYAQNQGYEMLEDRQHQANPPPRLQASEIYSTCRHYILLIAVITFSLRWPMYCPEEVLK